MEQPRPPQRIAMLSLNARVVDGLNLLGALAQVRPENMHFCARLIANQSHEIVALVPGSATRS